MKGHVTLKVIESKTGIIVKEVSGDNIILNQSASQLAQLFGGVGDGKFASQMQFGTGDVTELASDTTLQRPITPLKAITLVEFPDSRTMELTAFLLEDEANGFPIEEVGLMNDDEVLLARITLASAQEKSVDFQFQFTWRITA